MEISEEVEADLPVDETELTTLTEANVGHSQEHKEWKVLKTSFY